MVYTVSGFFIIGFLEKDFWIKLPKDHSLVQQKKMLQQILADFHQKSEFRSVRIVVNVDA